MLDLGETLEGLFTGYIVWMIVLIGYQDLAYDAANQADRDLELYLSPLGYKWLALFTQSLNTVLNLALVC